MRASDRSVVEDAKPIALLGLVMIVKDEAHGIEATLRSFLPAIDSWTILDTGSTDGTQDVIRRCVGHLPGQLVEEPFIDFATSRNRALELHGERTVFTIMPDSDDRLDGAQKLRSFLGMRVAESERSYGVMMYFGNLAFQRAVVHRTSARPAYVGKVHECLNVITTTNVPGVFLTQEKPPDSLEATKKRWERDRELLRAEIGEDPLNARAHFYLGQTYECLGDAKNAIEHYEKRVNLGGFRDEVFMAKLRRARLLTGGDARTSALLDAHAFDGRRAEPLFTLAQDAYTRNEHALTYLFARRADEMTPPDNALFVEIDVHQWRAADLVAIAGFYLADQLSDRTIFEIGRRAAEKVVRVWPNDARIQKNLSFYANGSIAAGKKPKVKSNGKKRQKRPRPRA